jgi:1-acyl-sn-glycerol-3-phosphate acyltransferase
MTSNLVLIELEYLDDQFSIGQAIPSVGRSAEELMLEVENWIEAEMHRLDPEAYPAKH